MPKNTIVGYPRVGSLRELKFWTEDYFRGNISFETLQGHAADLRKQQWLLQKQSGIDLIPSNDFSFYDGVLDTAYLLNAIPQAYQDLDLPDADTYFAMARGYQGEKGDVKALPMRKWFNTNYHYMVPLLDDDTQIRLHGDAPFAQYKEALALGIKTKPVLLGPFTFMKLAEYGERKKKADFSSDFINVYAEIFDTFNTLGAGWVQIDEPALVTDLDQDDVDLFVSLYTGLLPKKGGLKVLLQTYFGDIRDIYKEVTGLNFDGIGLDFIEGQKNLELVQSHGLSPGMTLFAGVVNGKNIWRNDYEKTLARLHDLAVPRDRIVISTSCSLLHAPYTLENENAMDERYKRHLAFAQEKLGELGDLKRLVDADDPTADAAYNRNIVLAHARQEYVDQGVREKIAALTNGDFVRMPAFDERKQIQQEALQLPLLPTTTIGSYPQTAEIKALRANLKKGRITPEAYKEQIREKIAACIALQEEIGLDVLVHGEYERNDMVEYFGQNLKGFLFTQKAWVQSYGTRCVKPPIIWSDIRRAGPITVEYSAYAQSLSKKPVKGMLTGPVTILNWSFPREDISNREMALQIALAIKEEVQDLEANGIRIIQVDEAALKEKLPLRRATDWHSLYLDWAIPAFRLVHASVKPAHTDSHPYVLQ